MNYDWIIIINSVFMGWFLIISGYWATVFIKRINCYRKYKRGAARCVSDEESGYLNIQICYHYETEIWKCVYLLEIILCEVLVGGCYYTTNIISHHIIGGHMFNSTSHLLLLNECKPRNETIEQYQNLKELILTINVIHGIGKSAEIFWAAVCVCLIRYLIIRIKKIKSYRNSTFSLKPYLITITLIVLMWILNAIQTLRIIYLIISNLFSIIYFYIFVKNYKLFKHTLLQRALERLIQYGSNKEEIKQYKYFKCTTTLLCFGILLVQIGQSTIDATRISVAVLVAQSCYFPFNLVSQFKEEMSNHSIQLMYKVSTNILYYSVVLCNIGILLGISPFLLVTAVIWVKSVHKYTRGTHKIKYTTETPSLAVPILTACE